MACHSPVFSVKNFKCKLLKVPIHSHALMHYSLSHFIIDGVLYIDRGGSPRAAHAHCCACMKVSYLTSTECSHPRTNRLKNSYSGSTQQFNITDDCQKYLANLLQSSILKGQL